MEYLNEMATLQVCGLDCGSGGECQGGRCVCRPGWTGPRCSSRACSEACTRHGQCTNGTCVCQQGWNGRHCSLEGCAAGCGGQGECRATGPGGDWECSCSKGWSGEHCQHRQETDCQDGLDNDKGEMRGKHKSIKCPELSVTVKFCTMLDL